MPNNIKGYAVVLITNGVVKEVSVRETKEEAKSRMIEMAIGLNLGVEIDKCKDEEEIYLALSEYNSDGYDLQIVPIVDKPWILEP